MKLRTLLLLAGGLLLIAAALATVPVPARAGSEPFVVTPGDRDDAALPLAIRSRLTGESLDAFVDGFGPALGDWFPGGDPTARGIGIAAPGPGLSTFASAWAPVPPPARWVHSMIYDPLRDRLVVFGGQAYSGNSAEVWVFYLSGIPRWQKLSPGGTSPSARAFHSAIYDSLGDRMIVFGGDDGQVRNDVWQLSFAGNPTWSPLASAGTPPAARAWHTAIHDRARNRMVVYGGLNGGTRYSDAWALSLGASPAWTLLAPTGSAPVRATHAAVYDAAGDRMIVLAGGDAGGVARNDVFALSFAGTPAWSALAPTGTPPAPRYGASALYDRLRGRVVLFAGGTGAPNTNETWTLTLGATPAWTALAPAGPPQGRQFHTVAYDPLGDRMLVFGGSSGPVLSDTWALSLTPNETWTPLSGTRRKGHVAVHDTVRDRMLIMGGENGSQLNDVWELGLTGNPTWARLNPTGPAPSPRALHAAIYDPRRDRLIVFGGRGGPPVNDLWELTFSGTLSWRPIQAAGTPPAPRLDHAMVYDHERYRLLVFGGADAGGVYDDVWALSLAGTPTWTQLATAGGTPAARGGAQVIYDGLRNRLVVYGGYNRNFLALSDAWTLSLSGTPTWSQLAPGGTPPEPRFAAATVYDGMRDRMVISSGTDFAFFFPDTWTLAFATNPPTWNLLALPGQTPSSRSDHKGILDPARDRMLLFGGLNPLGVLHDTWELGFANTVDAPGPGGGPVAGALALAPPAPNPSRGAVRLALDLPHAARVEAAIYDLAGRRVRGLAGGERPAGRHALSWDGADEAGSPAPAGIYFVQVITPHGRAVRKLVRID